MAYHGELSRWCRRMIAIVGVIVAGGMPSRAEPSASFCLTCHAKYRLPETAAHMGATCQSCHPGQAAFPHSKNTQAVSCATCHAAIAGENAASVHGQARKRLAQAPDCSNCHGGAHELKQARSDEFRRTVPAICGGCHAPIAREYSSSVHGTALRSGILTSAVCTDCHGEHSIQRASAEGSSVSPARVAGTCARCHGDVRLTRKFGLPSDRVVSFNASFHGLAGRSGRQTVANCASCHGTHNILPASDPRSTVNPKNVAATCSRCHAGAGKRFALGPVHVWPGRTEPAAVTSIRLIYLLLIPALGALMVLHNGGDWLRKTGLFRRRDRRSTTEREWSPTRMSRFERLIHAGLAVSFITLAWTGFDLIYPEQWWAKPILAMEKQWELRGVIHRAAALAFIATVLLHIGSLGRSRAMRAHWLQLRLSAADFRTALRALAYNLGLSAEAPPHQEYGYIEKFTYWGTVSGAAIMIASGLILWLFRYAIGWIPKPLLDAATAIHFYEAILACVTVVAWHAYRVIFDPRIYPMDTTWITGRYLRPATEHGPESAPNRARPEQC